MKIILPILFFLVHYIEMYLLDALLMLQDFEWLKDRIKWFLDDQSMLNEYL